MTVLGIIGSLLVLTVLVAIHEWGHMTVGRRLGFTVEEYAIGFGPKLLKWTKKGILYSIRCLPLGGFCRFYGEYEDDEPAPQVAKPAVEKHAFNKMPPGRRVAVLLAGPLVNLIFAIIITVVVLCAFGDYVPVIASVSEDFPAQEEGIQAGDRLIQVDGKNIDFYTEMQLNTYISGEEGDVTNVVVLRDGERISFDVGFKYSEENGRAMIGISYGAQRIKYGFFEAAALSFKWLYINVAAIFQAISQALFGGMGTTQMTGVVGTVALMSQIIRTSFENTLRVAAIISINLGVINLFPIPALDGGKIVLVGIEKLRRKPLSEKVEAGLNIAGFALLAALAVLLTIQDITALVGG